MGDPYIISGFPTWVDHALVWIFGCILPFLSGVKGREQMAGAIFSESARRKFYLGNSLFLFLAAGAVSLSWFFQDRSFDSLGFRNPDAGTIMYTVPLTFGILVLWLADFIHSLKQRSADASSGEQADEFPPFLPRHRREMPAYMLLSLSAAIFEETIYRGFMVTYFLPESRGHTGWPLAALTVPAVLFSLAHYYQGWKAVLKIWGFSVGLGVLFIISGSLWPVMIIHFIIDFAGGWMAMRLSRK